MESYFTERPRIQRYRHRQTQTSKPGYNITKALQRSDAPEDTWSLILIKAMQHIRLSRDNRRFSEAFWHAPNLQAAADLSEKAHGPAARLSAAGLHVLRDDTADEGADLEHTSDRQDLLERALRQQIHKERRKLERGLAVLASIGSTSPFVGLFGTVWGIMHVLTDISKAGSASLEVVAGPIGEALVPNRHRHCGGSACSTGLQRVFAPPENYQCRSR